MKRTRFHLSSRHLSRKDTASNILSYRMQKGERSLEDCLRKVRFALSYVPFGWFLLMP